MLFKEFAKSFLFTFLIMVFFFANPGFAYKMENPTAPSLSFADTTTDSLFTTPADGTTPASGTTSITTPASSGTSTLPTSSPTSPPALSPTAITAAAGCTVSSLSPQEAQNVLDIAHSGFQGQTMNDGSSPDKTKSTDLNGVQLVSKDNDGNTAIKVTPPTQSTPATKYGFLDGRSISGPFGVGLILDDTLRVGECQYPVEEQDKCRINGNGLTYRTSGAGVKENFSSALDSLKDGVSQKAQGVTEEQYQQAQNNFFDNNENNLVSYTVSPTEKIKNYFAVQSYDVKKATNCNGSTCIISTYSSFDKYFNSWYSLDMVVSSFGPTLLNKASKIIGVGSTSSASWLNKTGAFFDKWIDKTKKVPLEVVGDTRLASWKRRLLTNPELKGINDKLTVNKKLFSTEGGGLISDMFKEGSDLQKLSPESKQEFFKAMDDLRSWIREENAKVQGKAAVWRTIVNSPTATAAEKTAANIEFGRSMADTIVKYDDETALDFIEWFKDSGALGDMAKINLKKKAFGAGGGVVNMASDPAYNLKGIMKVFRDKGDWSDFAKSVSGSAYEVDAAGNLIEYEIVKSNIVEKSVPVDDLIKHVAKQQGTGVLSVRIPATGDTYELTEATVKMLQAQPNLAATVDIVTGEWAPKVVNGQVQVMTPEEFASRLTQDRIIARPNTAERNATTLYNIMRNDPNYVARKSFSLYDAQIAKEKNFLLDYYKQPFQTGIWKGTVLPILYWNVKRGAGIDQLSGYMLPDTWTTVEITPGTDEVYKDSYTDFYANEGSDQGDLFAKFISQGIFIWKYIADQFTAEEFPWAHDWLTRVAGSENGVQTGGFNSKSITRDTVQDVAFYSHNENCAGCTANTDVQNGYLTLTAQMPTNIQAFLVEAVDSDTAKKIGTTLIAYTHHADISGKSGNVPGQEINLADARVQGTTCEQALKELPFIGWVPPRAIGGVLGVAETLGYTMGFGVGITATVTSQLLYSRKLQDCVDDIDGYYIHFFSPPASSKVQPKEQVSNENISEALDNLTNKVSSVTSDSDSPIADSLDKIKNDFQSFTNSAQNDDVLQANIQLLPPSSGSVTGKEVFYIWYKDSAMPAGYKTEGKLNIGDDGNTVSFDFGTGELSFNGKTVIGSDKADHVRLATTPSDNRIPGIVIPQTLNKIGAPGTSDPVFELHAGGDIIVVNTEVLDCIRKAIQDQTGIAYNGNELTQVFGNLQGISTANYSKIYASDGKIYLEGQGPRVQGGVDSTFVIDGFWNSRLVVSESQTADAGQFKAMTFEYGTIVLKPETGEIIIWLRQHKESILSNSEVAGLNAKLSSVTDPTTGCVTPAINLDAVAHAGDELGAQRVSNFNTSMDHLGPFTQFVTNDKIYEFYSKRENGVGDCKQYFRIIDRNTGDVLYDGQIQGGVTQSPDGTLSFKTADGQDHTLKFGAENGVPTLSYNGGPQETLRSAQGPNGSFWYDPNTGLWYPENGLQIPLSQAFKDNGTLFASDGKGGVTGTAANPMTFNIGSQTGNGFNIPSLPETAAGLVLFIGAFLVIAFVLTRAKSKHQRW